MIRVPDWWQVKDGIKSPLIIKYQALYKEDPDSRVFAPLAEAYRKFGMVDDAVELLKKGIKRHPEFILGYLGLANCYFDKEEYNMAYETLRPLVQSNRENIRLQKLFGESCLKLNKKKEALDTFKYLLFINPKDYETADKISGLEDEYLRGNLVENEINSTDSTTQGRFAVEELNNFVEDKSVDEWVRVDLPKKQVEQREESDNWQMKKLPEVESGESYFGESGLEQTSETVSSISIVEDDDELEDSGGVQVSHTLVDLFIEQGQRTKAIEVLEKIVELNPTDRRSIGRLKTLKDIHQIECDEFNYTPQEDGTSELQDEGVQIETYESIADPIYTQSATDAAIRKKKDLLSQFYNAINQRKSEKNYL